MSHFIATWPFKQQRSKESCQALHWLTFVADSRSAAAQKTDPLGDGTAVAAGRPAATSGRPDWLRSYVALGQRSSSFAQISFTISIPCKVEEIATLL